MAKGKATKGKSNPVADKMKRVVLDKPEDKKGKAPVKSGGNRQPPKKPPAPPASTPSPDPPDKGKGSGQGKRVVLPGETPKSAPLPKPSTYETPADILKLVSGLPADRKTMVLDEAEKVGATSIADLHEKTTYLKDVVAAQHEKIKAGLEKSPGTTAGVSNSGSGEGITARMKDGLGPDEVRNEVVEAMKRAGLPEGRARALVAAATGTGEKSTQAAIELSNYLRRGSKEIKESTRRTLASFFDEIDDPNQRPLAAEVQEVIGNFNTNLAKPAGPQRQSGLTEFVRATNIYPQGVPAKLLQADFDRVLKARNLTVGQLGNAGHHVLGELQRTYGKFVPYDMVDEARTVYRKSAEMLGQPSVDKRQANLTRVVNEAVENVRAQTTGLEAVGATVGKRGIKSAPDIAKLEGLVGKARAVMSPNEFAEFERGIKPKLDAARATVQGVRKQSDVLRQTLREVAEPELVDVATRSGLGSVVRDPNARRRALDVARNLDYTETTKAAETKSRGILRERLAARKGELQAAREAANPSMGRKIAGGVGNFLKEVATQTLKHPIREAGLGLGFATAFEGAGLASDIAGAGIRKGVRAIAGNTEERQLELAYKSAGDPALAARLEMARQQTATYQAIRDSAIQNAGYITPSMLRDVYSQGQGAQTTQGAQAPQTAPGGDGLGLGSELH